MSQRWAGGRRKEHRRGQVAKVGKQAGGGRNRASSGVTWQGVRASWQEGSGIGGRHARCLGWEPRYQSRIILILCVW